MKKSAVNNEKKQISIYDKEIAGKLNNNNYNSTQYKYLKIILYDHNNFLFLRDILEKYSYKGNFIFEAQIFKSKINFPNKLMLLREIVEGSNYQTKALCFAKDVILLLNHVEISKLEPLKSLSWCIGCPSEEKHFPLHEIDKVIQTYNESNDLLVKKGNSKTNTKKKSKTKIKSVKNSFTSNRIIFGFQNKFTMLIIYFFIMINIIASICSKSNKLQKNRKLYLSNEIKIKIAVDEEGTDEIFNLFSDFVDNPPSMVLLNGNTASLDGNEIANLIEGVNNITMIWESKLNNCDYMFYELENIIEVDLSNFDASEVTSMIYMFATYDLISINFGNINTPELKNINGLFSYCLSLVSIDLSSFDTSLVTDMGSMFSSCVSLVSINFGNFVTSQVTDMSYLFDGCYKLTSLDLSSFNSSSVITMERMFSDCSSLISLDLSHFRTTSVKTMDLLFSGCSNLEYVDISNFDLTQTTNAQQSFYDCQNLKYINLRNFKEGNSINFDEILEGVSEDITFCISDEDNNPSIMGKFENRTCAINDCSDD